MTQKIIIAGSRNFDDYSLLKNELYYFTKDLENVEIISGNAKGADTLGERYAKEKNLPLHLFPADWGKYGNKAGYVRNVEMAEHATHCICFWDGKSKGTKMMIDIAKQKGIIGTVIMFTPK